MRNEKTGKHDCPKIDKELWSIKITGPAYRSGMAPEEARAAWMAYLRLLNRAVRPMPRKTY